jgi:hypothetical protein
MNSVDSNGKLFKVPSTSAEIVDLFKYKEDRVEFEETKMYGLKGRVTSDTVLWDGEGASLDGNKSVPRVIPKNTNYEIKTVGNRVILYRKTPVNYEEWVGGHHSVIDGKKFIDDESKHVNPEIVAVRITTGGNNSERKERTIIFAVCPCDKSELKYSPVNKFNVNECDEKVDIMGAIKGASLEGVEHKDIKFKIVGSIKPNGSVHILNTLISTDITKLRNDLGLNQLQQNNTPMTIITRASTFTLGSQGLYLGIGSNGQVDTNTKIGADGSNINLNDCVTDGKLCVYHENYGKPEDNRYINTKFNSTTQSQFRLIIQADYAKDGQICEKAYSEIKICVNPNASDFVTEVNQKELCYYITETLGTIAEGKSAEENNPKIPIKDFLSQIKHKDHMTGNKFDSLEAKDGFSFDFSEVDSDLEICYDGSNIFDTTVRLKNINGNKTQVGSENSELSRFSHYNYERKKEYNIVIKACKQNFVCLEGEAVPSNYVCGCGPVNSQNMANFEALAATATPKTADYIVDLNDIVHTNAKVTGLDDKKEYFVKINNKFLGPYKTSPSTLSQLNSVVEIQGRQIQHAEVMVQTIGGSPTWQPLYLQSLGPNEKKESDSKPEPEECSSCIFKICVRDTIDSAKCSIQPYYLDNDCADYDHTDPMDKVNAKLTSITKFLGSNKSDFNAPSPGMYVYTDHRDLKKCNKKLSCPKPWLRNMADFDVDEQIPKWHPDYKHDNDKNKMKVKNTIPQTNRRANVWCQANQINPVYQDKTYTGSTNYHANGSYNFGKFADASYNDAVVLEYFVEFHDCIDASGYNEQALSLNGVDAVIGKRVDHSGTCKIKYYDDLHCTYKNVTNSDKRMYRLTNMIRGRKHKFDINSSLLDEKVSDQVNTYTSGQMKFKGSMPQKNQKYKFSIAAVTNLIATDTDLSYNPNMVDFVENQGTYSANFYPMETDSIVDGTKRYIAQPFQKYVYNANCENIVTKAYANKSDVSSAIDTSGYGQISAKYTIIYDSLKAIGTMNDYLVDGKFDDTLGNICDLSINDPSNNHTNSQAIFTATKGLIKDIPETLLWSDGAAKTAPMLNNFVRFYDEVDRVLNELCECDKLDASGNYPQMFELLKKAEDNLNFVRYHMEDQTKNCLYVCRRHFEVCVTSDKTKVTSLTATGSTGNYPFTETSFKLSSTDLLTASFANSTPGTEVTNIIDPLGSVGTPASGDIRMFKDSEGTIVLAFYTNNQTWQIM